jgi:hypothetical protein
LGVSKILLTSKLWRVANSFSFFITVEVVPFSNVTGHLYAIFVVVPVIWFTRIPSSEFFTGKIKPFIVAFITSVVKADPTFVFVS